MLNYDINDVLRDLEFDLKQGSPKNRFFKRQNSYEDEIILRLEAKEKITEIKRLKEEVMNNEDKLLTAETNIFKLLTDLKHEEEHILYDIMTSELRLKKLGVSSIQINRIKNLILSS